MGLRTKFLVTKEFTVPAGNTVKTQVLTLPSDATGGMLEYLSYEVKPSTASVLISFDDRGAPLAGLYMSTEARFSTPVIWGLGVALRQNAVISVVAQNTGVNDVNVAIGIVGWWEV